MKRPIPLPIPRKPRSDSRLDKLPIAQRNALLTWLHNDRLTNDQAAARLLAEYQVKSSATAIRNFYSRHLTRLALEKAVQVHLKDYAPELHDSLQGSSSS